MYDRESCGREVEIVKSFQLCFVLASGERHSVYRAYGMDAIKETCKKIEFSKFGTWNNQGKLNSGSDLQILNWK